MRVNDESPDLQSPAHAGRSPSVQPPLTGRTIVITGAGHGIGTAYARACVEAGARVVLGDIDRPAVESLAHSLDRTGHRALPVELDVTNLASARKMLAIATKQFGSVTGLINNAAVFATVPMSRVPFDEIPELEWDAVMNVNVKGVWTVCRAIVPAMRDAGYGKIVNVSSAVALAGSATRAHYVASKAAILGLTKSLARELGSSRITVNAIAPGSTLSEDPGDDAALALREGAVPGRPLGRLQYPSDLAGSAIFLLSADSDFITGQTLVVDGGVYMH